MAYQKKASLLILIVMLAILPSCQTTDFQETELDRGVLGRSLTVYGCEEAHAYYYVETALVKTEDDASELVQRCERFFSSLQERIGMNAVEKPTVYVVCDRRGTLELFRRPYCTGRIAVLSDEWDIDAGAALAGAYLNIDAVWAQQGLAMLLLGGGTETSVGTEPISLFAGRFDSALADEKEIARTRSACALLVKELLLEDGNLCELGQTHLQRVWGVINSVSLDTSLADASLLDDPGCRLVVQVNGSTYRFEKGSNSDITLWGVEGDYFTTAQRIEAFLKQSVAAQEDLKQLFAGWEAEGIPIQTEKSFVISISEENSSQATLSQESIRLEADAAFYAHVHEMAHCYMGESAVKADGLLEQGMAEYISRVLFPQYTAYPECFGYPDSLYESAYLCAIADESVFTLPCAEELSRNALEAEKAEYLSLGGITEAISYPLYWKAESRLAVRQYHYSLSSMHDVMKSSFVNDLIERYGLERVIRFYYGLEDETTAFGCTFAEAEHRWYSELFSQ